MPGGSGPLLARALVVVSLTTARASTYVCFRSLGPHLDIPVSIPYCCAKMGRVASV